MIKENGYLVISLDFELFWGIFDAKSLDSYKNNLINVRKVIPRLIELCDTYDIKLNFASVGLLFAKSKEDMLNLIPDDKPTYKDKSLNPYNYLNSLGTEEDEDPYHYGNSLLKMINSTGKHEISSHTFSHYYCNEKGQNKEQFEEDIKANIKIAKLNKVDIKSIVFPRNQINKNYLPICQKHGILSYRGTEKHWMYKSEDTRHLSNPINKALRLMDAYFNISGHNTYNIEKLKEKDSSLVNIPSSRFLRPYSKKLSILEPLKVLRIKNAMTHAAKTNEMYHLWWHPHNFGEYIDENFKNLEHVFKHYKKLNLKYNYSNATMADMTTKITTS